MFKYLDCVCGDVLSKQNHIVRDCLPMAHCRQLTFTVTLITSLNARKPIGSEEFY
jgi:hypothetical protein